MRQWRVGRSVGRTLYIQTDAGPGKYDRLVGLMDTRELADLVVEAVNHWQSCDCLEDCAARYHDAEVDGEGRPHRVPPKVPLVNIQVPVEYLDDVELLWQHRDLRLYRVPAYEVDDPTPWYLLGPSVLPDDDSLPVVAVDSDSGVDVVPEDGGPVTAPPAKADLPVVPLDPLRDDADSGHA